MCLPLLNKIRSTAKFRKASGEFYKTAPKAERTAQAPTLGGKRTTSQKSTRSGTKAARRFGTRSLRIPLSSGSGNLNY